MKKRWGTLLKNTPPIHCLITLPSGTVQGKRAKNDQGDNMDKEEKVLELKNAILEKLAVIQNIAPDQAMVQRVVMEVNRCATAAENGNCVEELLKALPKVALAEVNSSTSCGNMEHKVNVLSKAVFSNSVDQVRAMESAFTKLNQAMKIVIELMMTVSYHDNGAMCWKKYTTDVFNAK